MRNVHPTAAETLKQKRSGGVRPGESAKFLELSGSGGQSKGSECSSERATNSTGKCLSNPGEPPGLKGGRRGWGTSKVCGT